MKKQRSFINNISWIFVGNFAHALLSFFVTYFAARCLCKDDYGLLNYSAAWISVFSAIGALGINGVINKFTSDDLTESNTYLTTAIIGRTISAAICMFATFITVFTINKHEKSIIIISFIQSLSILFSVGDTLVYWFRFKREANLVAIARLISFILSALIRIIAIIYMENIFVYSLAVVIEPLLFSVMLIYIYRKRYTKEIQFSFNKLKELISKSYPFIFSAVLVTIYAQTDRIMLKNIINNDAVASYSVACTISGFASVIISAVIEGFRPEIFRYKDKEDVIYLKRLKQAYFYTFWLSVAYCVFVSFFSKPILFILYGQKYLESSSVLALVVWYTSVSYLGIINNIYFVAENKQKWVYVATLSGAISNVFINLFLIPRNGIMGAALASLVSQAMANIIILFIVPEFRPLAWIIIRGIFDIKNASVNKIVNTVLNKLSRK